MHKVGRNDLCPCGSGKKFKKCCDAKHKPKKFEATVLAQEPKSLKFTSLFQRTVKEQTISDEKSKDIADEKNVIM